MSVTDFWETSIQKSAEHTDYPLTFSGNRIITAVKPNIIYYFRDQSIRCAASGLVLLRKNWSWQDRSLTDGSRGRDSEYYQQPPLRRTKTKAANSPKSENIGSDNPWNTYFLANPKSYFYKKLEQRCLIVDENTAFSPPGALKTPDDSSGIYWTCTTCRALCWMLLLPHFLKIHRPCPELYLLSGVK